MPLEACYDLSQLLRAGTKGNLDHLRIAWLVSSAFCPSSGHPHPPGGLSVIDSFYQCNSSLRADPDLDGTAGHPPPPLECGWDKELSTVELGAHSTPIQAALSQTQPVLPAVPTQVMQVHSCTCHPEVTHAVERKCVLSPNHFPITQPFSLSRGSQI